MRRPDLDELSHLLLRFGRSKFERRRPSNQNAVDIFKGHWASSLKPLYSDLEAGEADLFRGSMLADAARLLGNSSGRLDGLRILELGPLEGGHTYQLANLGAAEIVSIETNIEAYLKCLIVKEISRLERVQFFLGDFIEYLKTNNSNFDIIFACGVLYHMNNPLQLISLIAENSDKCFIATHFYDERHPKCLRYKKTSGSFAGFAADFYQKRYLTAWSGRFWGGNTPKRAWLTKQTILSALRNFGFDRLEIIGESAEHPNGPVVQIVASK